MKSKGVVVAIGMCTSVGENALETAMRYRAGAAGMREAPLVDLDGDAVTMCFVPTLPPLLAGWERGVALAQRALDECLGPLAGRLDASRTRFFMCIDERFAKPARGSAAQSQGTAPIHGAALVHGVSEHAARYLPGVSAEVVARGGAAGAHAAAAAIDVLSSRAADLVLVGATHTDYDVERVRQLSADRRIFKPDNLDALIPGEAACFTLLAREEIARRLGLAAMAHVIATGYGHEAAREDNHHSRLEARGLTSTVRAAAASLAEAGSTAGWAITDLSFERRRVLEWQAMLIRTRKLWSDPYVVDSPAQRIGHLGAAGVGAGLALAALSFQVGSAPSALALVYGGSDAGDRGAVLLASP